MSRLFYHTMQDNAGNLLFDVTGTMRLAGTGTLATIYGDEALTIPLPNPMTNHPSFGSFKCFLGSGDYDFYMAKSGYAFETLTGVQGHGTMAQQDYDAVSISGGQALGLNQMSAVQIAAYGNIAPFTALSVLVDRGGGGWFGIALRNNGVDTGPGFPVVFQNVAGTQVGSISTNATTTAYNTTSDARLKEAVEPLAGALDVVRALNPVAFLWKADGTPGRGLLAYEVQEVIPDGVITGEKDALDDEGQIQPQMINYSSLVPYLIGSIKELCEQVHVLQARIEALTA